MHSPADRLYTLADASRILGVPTETVILWTQRGVLPYITSPGGQRRYIADEIDRIHKQGMAVKALRSVVRNYFDGDVQAAMKALARELPGYRPADAARTT
jgi:DNA-binding transcriptional MerR regulator